MRFEICSRSVTALVATLVFASRTEVVRSEDYLVSLPEFMQHQYNDEYEVTPSISNIPYNGMLEKFLNMNNKAHRTLQYIDPNEVTPLDPQTVCEGYNNATNVTWKCECERYDKVAVLVNCTYLEPQCTDDETFCYVGYIETVIEARNPNITISNVTTSCFNITTSKPPEFVCVRIFPNESGNFTTIKSCGVEYNGTVCSSCEPCQPDPNSNTTNPNATHISINCCNVVTDKKQTCSSISENGATVAIFDFIEPGDEGKCSRSAEQLVHLWWFVSLITMSTMYFML